MTTEKVPFDLDLEKELEEFEAAFKAQQAENPPSKIANEIENGQEGQGQAGQPTEEAGAEEKKYCDYRVYYDGIDTEFSKSEDCQFKFLELKLNDPTFQTVLDDCKKFLEYLKSQCKGELGPVMLCTAQQNAEWYARRSERVTSSLFGRVAKRKKFDPVDTMLKFVQNHMNPYRYLGGIEQLEYGKLLESDAVKKYQKERPHIIVKETGLWTNGAFPYLGGSPDGLVFDKETNQDGLLEIKCPVRGKSASFEEMASQKGFYMLKDKETGKYNLDKKSEYYFQIQGCLNILDKPFCDFAVSTGKDLYVERIKKDEQFFKEFSKKVKEFFFRFFLPYNSKKPVLTEKLEWIYVFLSKEVYDAHFANY